MDTKVLQNYINGEWVVSHGEALVVENPATGAVMANVPLSTVMEADTAVDSAAMAYRSWRNVPVSKRVSYLYDLLDLMRARYQEIVRVLVAENGKSLADARAEMKRTLENIETACGMPLLQQGDKLVGVAEGIDGEVLYLPKGVFAMIAPFNFPAMVPFWFLPYALATGNTFVLKPSEQAPMTMALIAELIHGIQLPAGVFNVVHGDGRVGERFVSHSALTGVSIVGSSQTARKVKMAGAESGTAVQAFGGAKNHLVVMPDAQIDQVIRNMITSCYGCAGQRCMAASAIVCVGEESYTAVVERFVAASREVVVADPLDPAVAEESMVMGPVISRKARERIEGLIETGEAEGATLALDGRTHELAKRDSGYFLGPTVFTDVPRDSTIHRTEIFGPVVVILKAASLDDAIDIINTGDQGNGASIYTQNGATARRFKLEVEAGMVGVNVGIPAPVAYLPFGGMKESLFTEVKAQGKSVIRFFTTEKVITERYWAEKE